MIKHTKSISVWLILNLEVEKNRFHALNDWFLTPQGIFVQKSIVEEINFFKDRLRGTTMLQLGLCGENAWLKDLSFRRQWIMTPSDESLVSLISSVESLPFERNSVDCIIAPFTLEIYGKNKRAIFEMDRVLKPMGHIIFIGINPLSLWGLYLKLGLITCFDSATTLTSSLILKQIMFNQGYRQCSLKTFCYVPPVRSQVLIDKLRFLNEMGKMVILSPSGFYCLVVQKYQYAMPKRIQSRKRQSVEFRRSATGLARLRF